ncbi:MAG: AsmA-like C-terminal region-containing protein [Vicinamibacterales bacterium]
MWKKILLGVLGLFVVAVLGLFLWVRSVLASDAVQVALAKQVSTAIGQPVTIGSVSASIYPRITVVLKDVAIGSKQEISVKTLDVGTDFRAMLSRRIEHATLKLDGARLTLPLPPLKLGSDAPAATTEPTTAPVEIVSIDKVILAGIEIISGGRTLKGNIEVVPQGQGVVVEHVDLSADDMSLTATGTITDLAGPAGDIAIKAGALNVDRLIAFFNDFSGGLAGGVAEPTASTPPGPTPTPSTTAAAAAPGAGEITPAKSSMHLAISIDAERATMGGLTIEQMSGKAVATDQMVTVEPLTFNLFNGQYKGGLSATLGAAQPTFRWNAKVTNINVAAATAYAGSPNTVTGTLNATVDIAGTGADVATAMKTVAGKVQLDIVNGIVKNLGIIRSVGAATKLSLSGLKNASAGGTNNDESFTRIGATVALANGQASTQDMRFDAADLTLQANGTAQLDGSAMNLKGRLELSEALSREINQTMLKLAQDKGRVVLPATITGSLAAPVVRVDTADLAKRALKNTAKEAAPVLINKGINRLMRR